MSNASKGNPSVLVIGGTGGIGYAVAKFYADRGCKVVITGRDQERTEGVAKDIGGNTRGIGLDIAEPETIEASLADIEHIDHLALVAGSLLPQLKGHNPVEPAKLGAAIISGPYVESFEDVFDALFASKGAAKVHTHEDIALLVAQFWQDEAVRQTYLDAARAVVANGTQAFAQTLAKLATLTPAKSPSHAPA